jgi:hypothetical protein
VPLCSMNINLVQLTFRIGCTPSSLAIVDLVVEWTAVVRAASSIRRFIMRTWMIYQRILLLIDTSGETFCNIETISTGKKRL